MAPLVALESTGVAWAPVVTLLSGHALPSALVGGCVLAYEPPHGSETPAHMVGLMRRQDRDHKEHTENLLDLRTNNVFPSRSARRYGCVHSWMLLLPVQEHRMALKTHIVDRQRILEIYVRQEKDRLSVPLDGHAR